MDTTRIIFIGDIFGKPGRQAVKKFLPSIREKHDPHMVIINGENSAAGFGITPDIHRELMKMDVDVVTTGNHIWDKKEIYDYLEETDRLIRPANYPHDSPGLGYTIVEASNGVKVGVINLLGRVFMATADCPFKVGEAIVEEIKSQCDVIFIDFHGEATSEKTALGVFLDGKVGAVVGTHSHVQTADERILPGGTAYMTDAGMTGARDSVIGVQKEIIVDKFLTGMPRRYEVASSDVYVHGVCIEVDNNTGLATNIERIQVSAS